MPANRLARHPDGHVECRFQIEVEVGKRDGRAEVVAVLAVAGYPRRVLRQDEAGGREAAGPIAEELAERAVIRRARQVFIRCADEEIVVEIAVDVAHGHRGTEVIALLARVAAEVVLLDRERRRPVTSPHEHGTGARNGGLERPARGVRGPEHGVRKRATREMTAPDGCSDRTALPEEGALADRASIA